MRLNSEFLGKAFLDNREDVIAGSQGSWKLTYVVGKYGIDDTGEIMIAQRTMSDWEQPQLEDLKSSGYTKVETNGNAKLEVKVSSRGHIRPWRNCIKIKVYNGYLEEGEKIEITFGDRSEGGPGMMAQSFCETEHMFKILVDPFGTGRFEELPKSPVLKVVSGPASELNVLIPSLIKPDEKFNILVRVLDEWGNPCNNFNGEIDLSILSESENEEYCKLHSIILKNGYKKVKDITIDKEGIFTIKAECRKENMSALSNRLICREDNDYKLFWGDMHGQTEITIGTGSLEEYFEFAKGPAGLDFTGWQGNDFQISDSKWERVKNNVAKYNTPEEFITFLGYEWSGLTSGGGDHNIYYLGDDGPLYHSNQWLVNKGTEDDGKDRYPISELWEEFSERDDVMAVPHIGGRRSNLDYYNPRLINLIEIHSHHGTFEWLAEEALERGLKVGFIAGSDDHSGRPGLSYPTQRGPKGFVTFDVKSGYVATFSKELTREKIWEALNARRCYATTAKRINMNVKIDNHYMGEEFDYDKDPRIDVNLVGTSPIQYIEIKNGREVIHKFPQVNKQNYSNKIKIMWGGLSAKSGRSKKTIWDGNISIEKGKITSYEDFAFDRKEEGIKLALNQLLKFKSTTSGDVDGLIIEVDYLKNNILRFQSKQIQIDLKLDEITEEPIKYEAGGINQFVEISKIPKKTISNKVEISYIDNDYSKGVNPYWVKVLQVDGNMAWSSPIYVNMK